MIYDPDDTNPLPFDDDAIGGPQKPEPTVLGDPQFRYIGQALTLVEFEQYVSAYNFGKVPPDSVCFHHTANPSASWAPLPNSLIWDANESRMSEDQVKAKRLRQLGNIKNYYQHTLKWDRGFHLAIDDLWVYLFTPMYDVGIHAKWGNSFRAHGKLHYSIGIEVIGYYEKRQWPAPVRRLVGGAVRALQGRLKTFEFAYMYPDNKPGMITLATGEQRCAHPERLKFGGLSSHADYNKPACPGAAITSEFYTKVCQG